MPETPVKSGVPHRWTLVAVAVVAGALVAYGFDARWFEDDAMISMQYARNVAGGCGWSFNCGADDFATTSFLHTAVSSIAFHVAADPDAALVLVKVYESAVIVLAVTAFFHLLVVAGIGPFAAAIAAICLLANDNTFTYLSSGMENALYLLALSAALTAGIRRRYGLTGALTGVCHLVRPEAALVGPVAALVDLVRRRPDSRAELRRWLGDWTRAGAASLAVAGPVWLLFLVLKGTPLPVSAEIKLLTAANWGPFQDLIPSFIAREAHWLPFAAAGLVVAVRRRSPALGPILTAVALVTLYWLAGMPRSPWYYLPLHFGLFAAGAAGIDAGANAVRRWRPSLAPVAQTVIVVLLVSPVIDAPARFERTVVKVRAIAAKRHDINARTGRWLQRNAPPDVRVAIPNIGYIGFHGGFHLVDFVGLVTPDVARRRASGDANYWYDTYRPELYGNKAVPSHPRFDDPRYALVSVQGRPAHHRERYALWLRRDLATHRVRRSWVVSGDRFRTAGALETKKASGTGTLQIEIPAKPPAVTLTARLDDAVLSDGTFPASDLVIHLIHDTPPAPLRQVTILLESESASGPGHALLRMNRGFLPERRQHSVLSQENVVGESNFNPGRVVRVQLDYAFADPPAPSGRLSVERLEIISFAGCRLAGDCTSRVWR